MKYLKLFPLLFLCAWTPSSGDVTKLSTAERVILEAYAQALAILPDGAQQTIQKKLGIWVRDNKGGSVWGNIEVSGSFPYKSVNSSVLNQSSYVYDCTFRIAGGGALYYFPDQAGFSNRTCTYSGFIVDYYGQYFPSYMANIATWGNYDDSFNKLVSYPVNTPPSSIASHCAVGRGYSSAGLRYGVPGNYYTDVLYYIPAANCQMNSFSEFSPRVLLDIPYTDNLNDTAEILSTLKSAEALTFELPVISTYTNGNFTFTGSTSIPAAIDYIENGVSVDGPIGQTSTIYPDTIYSGIGPGAYSPSGSSISVNVSVNVSTQEIVDQLKIFNSTALPDSTDTENYLKGLIDSAYSVVIDSVMPQSTLNKFSVDVASTTWEPCFNFAFSQIPTFGAADYSVCLSDFGNWDSVVLPLIQWALIFSTGLWCILYLWEGQ